MNPADECVAFKHYIDRGATAEDLAKRFGITTRFVEQRVRLAELARPVFEALAAGEITLGVAQAYAVTPDVERQARVRSEEHTSELQSLMRIAYAVFCLQKKKHINEQKRAPS